MIGLIGVNHQRAGVELRERLALSSSEASSFAVGLLNLGQVKGIVVLSTCNRVEAYYEAEDNSDLAEAIIQRLCSFKKVDRTEADCFYHYEQTECADHLFRLASGLDSMLKGETQILGQLKDAYRRATDNCQSSSTISRLFHKAFETAKLIRSEYILSSTPISAGAAAVEYMDSLEGVNRMMPTLILGAGLMAETIYQRLSELGYKDLTMYNRTRERAERFAVAKGIPYFCEGDLRTALAKSELIFVATSSLTPILTAEEMPSKSTKTYIFDVAVPRNVSPELNDNEMLQVFDIDALNSQGAVGAMMDSKEIAQIDACIKDKIEEFFRWMEGSQLRSIIANIQEVSTLLLEKECRVMPKQLSDEMKAIIMERDEHFRTTFTTAIVAALREITEDGQNMRRADTINLLFQRISEKEL